MKTILSILLVVLMFASMTVSAMADNYTVDADELGMKATLKESYTGDSGFSQFIPLGIISHEPFINLNLFYYVGLSEADYEKMVSLEDQLSEEDMNKMRSLTTINAVFVITNGDIEAALQTNDMTAGGEITKLAEKDGYGFYFVPLEISEFLDGLKTIVPEEQLQTAKDAFTADIAKVNAMIIEDFKAAEYRTPIDGEAKAVGYTLTFSSKDLNGNTVNSEDLFKDNEITMVNVWGTWCHNCVDEMEALAELDKKLRDMGCGIIGIEVEGDYDEETLQAARELLADKGVTYTSVIMPEGDEYLDSISGFPTTVFVDKTGTILTYPIVGAAVEQYLPAIEMLLKGDSASAALTKAPVAAAAEAVSDTSAAAANDQGCYRVIVNDSNGPVQGVTIQFCDESTCNLGKTDANGIATFEFPEGKAYEVHVLKVPEGYQKTGETFKTLSTYSDVVITIDKAA